MSAAVIAPAYPRRRAFFELLNEDTLGLRPDAKTDILLHAARAPDARHEKARVHDAQGGGVSTTFPDLTNCEIFTPQSDRNMI